MAHHDPETWSSPSPVSRGASPTGPGAPGDAAAPPPAGAPGPAAPAAPGAPHAAPSAPYEPGRPGPAAAGTVPPTTNPAASTAGPAPARPRRTWPVVAATAVVAALVASVATVGILTSGPASDGAPASAPAQVASAAPSHATPQVSGTTAWQDVVDRVAKSVVAITVEGRFGGSQGSGVIFDDQGHVLTNNHVVEAGTAGAIHVVLADGRVLDAQVVGVDETTDLGVLRLTDPPSDLVAATLGDSDSLRVGQPVMAVGNPLGLAGTVTTGIVSALDRPTVTRSGTEAVVTNAIQVDAAVNPGNSGGPLFDAAGRVVGINSSIATLSGSAASGSIGLGFAIPVNLARQVAQQLLETGHASHAFLGVTLADGTASVDGVARQGAVVGEVVPGSPAETAGIKPGDTITAIDGKPVASSEALTGYVRARAVGQESTLSVVRDGAVHEIKVKLTSRDESTTLRG